MHDSKDPNLFVKLLVAHQLRLYAYILSAVPSYSDADDVMQETSIALWEMFDQYRPDTDFGAWARSVARYRVLKYRERKARAPLPADDHLLESVSNRVFDEKMRTGSPPGGVGGLRTQAAAARPRAVGHEL